MYIEEVPGPRPLRFSVQIKDERRSQITVMASAEIDEARTAFDELCQHQPNKHVMLYDWGQIIDERKPLA
ncbi:MAG: hypothetical protein EOR85_13110 [Mesorhizobium sp.]|uniref:hypothetical protein n=1 Tax=Mesorhizobium sp. TaxID=1871066 RepID=UPI000FE66880|nr:hypothetical protein [Mesorhizobium sp.]RWK61775.1 MAG: hypothetical protein EOR49_15925 [Mesorhizobium sp.]RWM47706.1 MAG: hypothetical protein EOR76_14435 [Mesorhizobium sp.]RWN02438.1 MAG: hypothetical protein EOR85_13110 [Mesorhizobium sp.]